MNLIEATLTRPARVLTMLVVGLCALPALAESKAELSAAQARYRAEVAVCNSGQSNQDRQTCLREAGAAQAEARRGNLNADSADLRANQLKRCEPLSDKERVACVARMNGAGTATGTVATGGIYRELVVRETVQPSAPAPAPATPKR